uniref:Uncharacterized protein n=1 Tax=Oryza punctata TaxID=4537 RepID=A0A0E0K1C8_ORYPU
MGKRMCVTDAAEAAGRATATLRSRDGWGSAQAAVAEDALTRMDAAEAAGRPTAAPSSLAGWMGDRRRRRRQRWGKGKMTRRPYSLTHARQRPQNGEVTYLENNRAGITVYGFVVDRTWLHALFMIEFSLVMWLLGKTQSLPNKSPFASIQ